MDVVQRSQFDYDSCPGEDDINSIFDNNEYILKNLPYTMQIDENSFSQTFTNLYYWLLNQPEHPAKQLDDLFFEEYILRCTELAFQSINHRNLMKQIKNKVKLII